MDVFALPFLARRKRCRTEFEQWHDASRELQHICPPTAETATTWCRVVESVANDNLADEPSSPGGPAPSGVRAA